MSTKTSDFQFSDRVEQRLANAIQGIYDSYHRVTITFAQRNINTIPASWYSGTEHTMTGYIQPDENSGELPVLYHRHGTLITHFIDVDSIVRIETANKRHPFHRVWYRRHNETQRVSNARVTYSNTRGDVDELPAYAWPGGYPLFYVTSRNDVLCPKCANAQNYYDDRLVAVDINHETPDVYCDECSTLIEPAIGNDEARKLQYNDDSDSCED